eukprot:341212-Chlamydomonas_euryale.AAC.1
MQLMQLLAAPCSPSQLMWLHAAQAADAVCIFASPLADAWFSRVHPCECARAAWRKTAVHLAFTDGSLWFSLIQFKPPVTPT